MDANDDDVRDQVWERTLDFFMQAREHPDDPEMIATLVRWLNQSTVHLEVFNELAQIWIATGVALAQLVGCPLSDDEVKCREPSLH